MKRNKTFNIIVTLFALMPLIMLGVMVIVIAFNKNYVFTDFWSLLNDGFKNVLKLMGVNFNNALLTQDYYRWNVNMAISDFISAGIGFPFMKYFVVIFNNSTQSLILGENMLYLFINVYLNYVLLVYLVAFIPKILLTFINFGYNLCDRFTERSGRTW